MTTPGEIGASQSTPNPQPAGGNGTCERSFRACFWVEVEVSATDADEAARKAREVVCGGNFDAGQMDLDDVTEVDPLTGVER